MNDLPAGMVASPPCIDSDDCIVCALHDERQETMTSHYTDDGEGACEAHADWVPCGHGHYRDCMREGCAKCEDAREEGEE